MPSKKGTEIVEFFKKDTGLKKQNPMDRFCD